MIIAWLILGLIVGAIYVDVVKNDKKPIYAFSVGLFITASLYLLFALFGAAGLFWLLLESLGVLLFGCMAWLGVTRNILWLFWGWLLHPAWDLALHFFVPSATHAPDWYTVACVSFDLLVAAHVYDKRR